VIYFVCGLFLIGCTPIFAQHLPAMEPVARTKNLYQMEGTDAESGVHYIRLVLLLGPSAVDSKAPPRFTVECTEAAGKRDLSFLVTFGGVDSTGFVPPWRPTPQRPRRPKIATANLKISFEGYTRTKPAVRSWEVLPSGELRYRNPGLHSPNMETPRHFLAYLSSLPQLRIGYAEPVVGNPPDLVFDTQPLLDQLSATPLCQR
jgi:hypothetical protein